MIFNWLKNLPAIIGNTLVLILLSPIIIGMLIYVGIHTFVRFIFRKLRNDPYVKLTQFVQPPSADDLSDEEVFESAIKYFDDLTNEIGKQSGAKIGKLSKTSKRGIANSPDQNTSRITITKNISTAEAHIKFGLDIEKFHIPNEDIIYSSPYDGDDLALARDIYAHIKLEGTSHKENYDLRIQYDQVAAHFCIAVLSGKAKYNSKTAQMWAFLENKNTWMVVHKLTRFDEIGFRNKYTESKARLNWLDN